MVRRTSESASLKGTSVRHPIPPRAATPQPLNRRLLRRRLAQSVGTGAEEFEEAEVTKDLELLADFVIDVSIFGMEFG